MTSRPRFLNTEAVVVRLTDLGEADRLVVLLTPGRGLMRVTARGARKPGSKLGGHIDLLSYVNVAVASGRGMDTISQAETLEGFRRLRSDLGRLSRGLYLAELAERFSVEDAASSGPFRLLIEALRNLEGLESSAADTLLRWFELRLLGIHGFAPQLQKCVDCEQPLEQQDHVFSAARGGLVCPKCRLRGDDPLLPAPVGIIKVLRFLGRSSWRDAVGLKVGEDDRHLLERLLRSHLHYVLDRDVKSTAFLDEVRKRLGVAERPPVFEPGSPGGPAPEASSSHGR